MSKKRLKKNRKSFEQNWKRKVEKALNKTGKEMENQFYNFPCLQYNFGQ